LFRRVEVKDRSKRGAFLWDRFQEFAEEYPCDDVECRCVDGRFGWKSGASRLKVGQSPDGNLIGFERCDESVVEVLQLVLAWICSKVVLDDLSFEAVNV
jgi:hypothetical protein